MDADTGCRFTNLAVSHMFGHENAAEPGRHVWFLTSCSHTTNRNDLLGACSCSPEHDRVASVVATGASKARTQTWLQHNKTAAVGGQK